MKYFIIIIVFFITFFSTLSEDRKWYYIDSVEIDGRLDKINHSVVIVDSLNNKYFFEVATFFDEVPRLIKYDNYKWYNLNVKANDLSIASVRQDFCPQVDIDNSLWWISEDQLEVNKIVHFKDGLINYFYADSIYATFDTSYNKNRRKVWGLVIDRLGVKHFFTELGIVSFDNSKFSIDTNMNSIIIKNNNIFDQLFVSPDNNLILFNKYDLEDNYLKKIEIYEKVENKWVNLFSRPFKSQIVYCWVENQSGNILLVADTTAPLPTNLYNYLHIYEKKTGNWNAFHMKHTLSHWSFMVLGDFDEDRNFWFHNTNAPINFAKVNLRNGDVEEISQSGYQFKKYREIMSVRFDKNDNLWGSFMNVYFSNLDTTIFVYAKEKPLFVRNKNIDENLLLSLSPNPVNEKLTLIKIPDNATEFEIYDQFGNRQISGLISGQIDVSLLPPGVYFIKLNNSQRPLKFLKI